MPPAFALSSFPSLRSAGDRFFGIPLHASKPHAAAFLRVPFWKAGQAIRGWLCAVLFLIYYVVKGEEKSGPLHIPGQQRK
jgi:hypothetical protein